MKNKYVALVLLAGLSNIMCGGSSHSVRLGECPLTVTVKAEDNGFDGYANIFIDGKFIGTTDPESMTLRINLKKGEYTIIVVAEGFKPWKSKVLLLGESYQQNVLARLKALNQKSEDVRNSEGD